ncbi:MAG: hypothetical protein Q9168_000054 [Polycauliona sp. 1 TL-2023]
MNQSWDMPSADMDQMLNHVSSQMAKAQLFRRLSANSNNTSPSRRPNARVAKPHSNGATPHGVQRRRTTTAQTSQSKQRMPQPADPSQLLPPTAATSAHGTRNIGLSSFTRPLTWHPGAYPLDNRLEEMPYGDALAQQPFLLDQEPACAALFNYFPRPSFDSNASSNIQPRTMVSNGYSNQVPTELSTYPYPYYHPSSSYLQYGDGTSYSYESSFANIQPVDFSQSSSDYNIYSTQPTPDTLQFQAQLSAPQYAESQIPAKVTKQKSKELVGMGLYDGPSRRELSTFNVSPDHVGQLLAPPQGKGLRLEETWQPANDDDGGNAEEEGYSTDEAEEDFPQGPTTHGAQPALLPATYGDLSNQSFFFDSDDPYTDYMSFDSGVDVCQPKSSDVANQNFMWL